MGCSGVWLVCSVDESTCATSVVGVLFVGTGRLRVGWFVAELSLSEALRVGGPVAEAKGCRLGPVDVALVPEPVGTGCEGSR